ncbi:MAG TPA: ROK family transcriptional regulator [Ktedonobacteraceae bacterium]|nr:ROK family transcriptional regulator [Ktedonobacteraceae bacterium]
MTTSESENQPGTPRLLRAMNERGLLEHLRRNGPLSRAQLARETGLSKPTVSQALANLERAGLVRPIGQVSPEGGGRQAILYEPDPTAGYVVGVDIGRSWVRVAVADFAGTIVSRREEQNQATSAEALVEMATELAHHTVEAAGFTWSQVVHTVIGTPGVFHPPTESLLFASNLPDWGRSGLVEMLRSALGPSLTVDNDANLAALGEQTCGSGAGVGTFVFLTVGTGIGMGIVIDGALYRGTHGAGGEVGFLPLGAPETASLTAGNSASYRGMLEEVASAEGIVHTAQSLGMRPPLSARQIFDAARGGDKLALAVVEREGQYLALAVASVAAILDPELVVLGGGIGRNVDLLRGPLERRLSEITPLRPRIVASELGENAVLLGAISTALAVARDLVFQQRAGDGRIRVTS